MADYSKASKPIKPFICENCNAFYSASESHKQNLPRRSLDLSSFFVTNSQLPLKPSFALVRISVCMHKVTVCLTSFRQFLRVLSYWLREFPLYSIRSLIASTGMQSKAAPAIVLARANFLKPKIQISENT